MKVLNVSFWCLSFASWLQVCVSGGATLHSSITAASEKAARHFSSAPDVILWKKKKERKKNKYFNAISVARHTRCVANNRKKREEK